MAYRFIITVLIFFTLVSCSDFERTKRNLQGTWKGHALITFDSNYIRNTPFFPFSDSLNLFYQSFKADDYLRIQLDDSIAVVNLLNFYRNRIFAINWTPLKAGKNYIVLWTYTTAEDYNFREYLKSKVNSSADSLQGNALCLEMFDLTKDREIIFLKNIELKKDSLICDVEMDLFISARQKLLLKRYSDKK